MRSLFEPLIFFGFGILLLRFLASCIMKHNEKKFTGNKYWGHNSWMSSCTVIIGLNEIIISADLRPDYSIKIKNIKKIIKQKIITDSVKIVYLTDSGELKNDSFSLNAPNIFINTIKQKMINI